MDPRTELSEFLRSRRARLRPEDVGLPDYGTRRRVPGLRREELAQLAGVSTAYYIRLEQGHGENVSTAVLDSIARALRLTPAEREHLQRLTKPPRRRSGRAAAARPQQVRPALQQLLDAMEGVPAYVLGRRLDIVAWNRLGNALTGDFSAMPPEQRNMAWHVFLDPAARELYDDWEGKATDVVGILRLEAGRDLDDPRLASLIGELSLKSADFRRLWAAHDIRDKGHGTKDLHHPVVGRLTLRYETLRPAGDPDQVLVTYHAEPGSPSAESLRLLASWAATGPAEGVGSATPAAPAEGRESPAERPR
ncbi:helix-turn-helix domain-containing protein [Kitasatospora sp. A2-31]|uniref:helix-turn-helix domain-containing protein n=1 Tax=Kitasatospora sp. A2-31 TaxID=2916414 RepID=UPI001EEC35AE|nr:helix-turn-helix transcriptional regulator [Kitasatospora sp. A2-31]MCG6498540.1 helix-turn-helix transcriptional regulator [Kitasatospora sp. A2-31]MCG6500195.1 helix-turn-helix transcriptional regulator [Kitasatospora sp. A2-31]